MIFEQEAEAYAFFFTEGAVLTVEVNLICMEASQGSVSASPSPLLGSVVELSGDTCALFEGSFEAKGYGFDLCVERIDNALGLLTRLAEQLEICRVFFIPQKNCKEEFSEIYSKAS